MKTSDGSLVEIISDCCRSILQVTKSLHSGMFFLCHLQIAVGHWMTNGYTMIATPDYYKFVPAVGEILDPPYTRLVNYIPRDLPINVRRCKIIHLHLSIQGITGQETEL